ncbi:MAG: hypothetical protein IT327_13240 [Anaerolineae bacterium]|nr:hypothetical protein [Anaerolineae bacterium]
MKISTFKDDFFGLDVFAKRLESFIAVERQYVDGGLVIGLSSKFGSGKTTFLQMWKSSFEQKSDKENEKKEEDTAKKETTLAVLLNAWESDYYGDPLFAIISALVDTINKQPKISARGIVNAAKDVGFFTTVIGGQVLNKFTGVDVIEATESVEKSKKERENIMLLTSDTFSMYKDRKKAMVSLKQAILKFIEKNHIMVLFLVDELDRCRPDYAIAYLETIKHMFDIPGTVFLLASDRQHLENSAKTAFGAKLDFDEYYRKFVHREVSLPDISDSGYKKIASTYVSYYIEGSGNRYSRISTEQTKSIADLVGGLHLTPRQIQEIFRTLGHVFETTEDNKAGLLENWAVGTIILAIMKIAKPRFYSLLGSQQLPPKEALEFFMEHLKDYHAEWLFKVCLTGGGLKIEKTETDVSIMRNVGLAREDEGDTQVKQHLGRYYLGWGNYRGSSYDENSSFRRIFGKIEQLDQWS